MVWGFYECKLFEGLKRERRGKKNWLKKGIKRGISDWEDLNHHYITPNYMRYQLRHNPRRVKEKGEKKKGGKEYIIYKRGKEDDNDDNNITNNRGGDRIYRRKMEEL